MKVSFEIYKDGNYIATDFTFYIVGTAQVLESYGYTIKIIGIDSY